ncbi:hypothetical protein DCW30_30030 [Streptomyces alfalfae]|uniref:ESX secretion-associated protein EspG n=1 Tax=Streptomyces alfalfae TaxID=1642299 RepID=A0ABN4VHL8_9ACTN|nr:hypothetical protein [Streptomyces alfalfae]APY86970.1 hypothetical protein A7J05_15600 [Streptomyces alfalfae]AYA17360.1 hypothetical protein D3X13_14885 [Streptomyces fradiae]RXX37132.1 hypothetical protein DCW30_30030 [Streptomyces alfalfae]RZM87386.1 hypothetical protein D4104_27715 [Streptomyces alfalfae]
MPHPELGIELDKFREFIGEALAEGGTQPLIQLTDEELAVLDPTALEEVIAPTPHLATLTSEQREWVLATAIRSLVSRGAIEIANIPDLDALMRSEGKFEHGGTTDVDMKMTPDVDLALILRRTAARALAVEQQTSRGSVHGFVYVHSPELMLVEQVTGGGMHIFTLASSAADAAKMMQVLVDPFGVADEDGRTQRLDVTALTSDQVEGPLAEAVNNALVVTQLIVLADEPGPLVTAYATEDAVWTVSVDKPQAPTGIQARKVGERSLTSEIIRLITTPVP